MILAYCIFLFCYGLWIYRFHCHYLIHYFILWFCFGPIFINAIYTIEQEDYYNILTWSIYLSYAVAFIEIIKNGFIKDKWIRIIFIIVVLLNLYYVTISAFRGVSIIDAIKYISGYTGFLVSLCIIMQNETRIQSLSKFVYFIVIIEMMLALLQPYTDILNFHAALHGDDVMKVMVNGTFVRNNVFIEFITPMVMFVLYYDYCKYQKIRTLMWILLFVSLYTTYNSGVRTVLVAIIPVLLYAIYKILGKVYEKKITRFAAMAIYCIIIYSCYVLVQSIAQENGVTYTKNAEDSSQRQAVLLSMLNDNDFAEKQTTLGLSVEVLSTLPNNPLWGSGMLFQGDGYGGYISRKFGNETDATLAIFLCETGIIGIVLWGIIYYILLAKINAGNTLPKLIFIYLLIVTLIDPGLFFIANVLTLFISIKSCNILTKVF